MSRQSDGVLFEFLGEVYDGHMRERYLRDKRLRPSGAESFAL